MTQQIVLPGFHFSQSSLQDYVDCPRRFELRHILRQAWPAVQAQPVWEHERQMWRGTMFHRLVHQHALGFPVETLMGEMDPHPGPLPGREREYIDDKSLSSREREYIDSAYPSTREREYIDDESLSGRERGLIEDDDLRRWWQAYLDTPPPDLPVGIRLSEVTLCLPVGEYRLVAKYDLIAAGAGRVVIVDWKTNRHRPSSAWLARRLQSRVYPYVVTEAGAAAVKLTSITPGQVSMVYWFAEQPHRPEQLSYHEAQHEDNRQYLTALVAEIAARREGDFPLTDDERHCRFCVYRSLCEKDIPAGDISEIEDSDTGAGWADWDIDLDQVAEIAY